MDKQEQVSNAVMDVYKNSGMTMNEIIDNLNHLLSTAKWSRERVNEGI
jgi:hypothetical protein